MLDWCNLIECVTCGSVCFQVQLHVPRDMAANIFVLTLRILTSASVLWDMYWMLTRKHAQLSIFVLLVDLECVFLSQREMGCKYRLENMPYDWDLICMHLRLVTGTLVLDWIQKPPGLGGAIVMWTCGLFWTETYCNCEVVEVLCTDRLYLCVSWLIF